jgi:L-serine dehydratase
VVAVMQETGHNLPSLYRETATGGLATAYRRRQEQIELLDE